MHKAACVGIGMPTSREHHKSSAGGWDWQGPGCTFFLAFLYSFACWWLYETHSHPAPLFFFWLSHFSACCFSHFPNMRIWYLPPPDLIWSDTTFSSPRSFPLAQLPRPPSLPSSQPHQKECCCHFFCCFSDFTTTFFCPDLVWNV